MAQDVNLASGEVVRVNAPAGETLKVTGGTIGATSVTVGATQTPVEPPPPTTGDGVLVSRAEIMARPTSGAAWAALSAWASKSISTTGMLSNQDSASNVITLAAALVATRKSDAAMRAKVITALKALKGQSLGRALALGRELGAYVIASDVIGATDAEVGYDQKAFYRAIINKTTSEAGTLIQCAHNRPNNWGAHAQGSLACVYAFIGDTAGLAEVAKVQRGWLGDRSAYSGFKYGAMTWQADSSKPVGVNPRGSVKSGKDIDGAQPEEMRRGDATFPIITSDAKQYAPEALQGQLLAALVLSRHGYADLTGWSDRALLRAVDFIYRVMGISLSGDDSWQPHGWRKLYGASYGHSLPSATTPGKNLGYTDWLYG